MSSTSKVVYSHLKQGKAPLQLETINDQGIDLGLSQGQAAYHPLPVLQVRPVHTKPCTTTCYFSLCTGRESTSPAVDSYKVVLQLSQRRTHLRSSSSWHPRVWICPLLLWCSLVPYSAKCTVVLPTAAEAKHLLQCFKTNPRFKGANLIYANLLEDSVHAKRGWILRECRRALVDCIAVHDLRIAPAVHRYGRPRRGALLRVSLGG
eukprot:979224-Amphidinium_carterae.1